MKQEPTMSVAKISAFISVFETFGISKEDALRSAAVDPNGLASPDCRIRSGEIERIMNKAVELSGDENIGLKQGEKLARGFSNLIGYILINCPNLEEAARKYCRYEKIVDETSLTEMVIEGDCASIDVTFPDPDLAGCKCLIDYKIAGTLSYAGILSGKTLLAREIHLTYEPPQIVTEYQHIFQCPVFFGRPANRIVFDRELLNRMVVEPNQDLLIFFESKARELLNAFQNRKTYTQKVMQRAIKGIKGEVPTIVSIARELAVSPRSLQLYLKREGTTYLELINEVRKNVAFDYLKDPTVPIDEIAYLLGFSETSAFHRAFKKWTRLTPREFRNNCKTGLPVSG